jgi:hypothetical protein
MLSTIKELDPAESSGHIKREYSMKKHGFMQYAHAAIAKGRELQALVCLLLVS